MQANVLLDAFDMLRCVCAHTTCVVLMQDVADRRTEHLKSSQWRAFVKQRNTFFVTSAGNKAHANRSRTSSNGNGSSSNSIESTTAQQGVPIGTDAYFMHWLGFPQLKLPTKIVKVSRQSTAAF